ncbi:MAG: hypothetical protein EPO08_09880 [Rhodospirillaceae bacterium]|nr:MAG: hypothetical protein EPO08_09880 [Rhodospirillaceae bacterium]
MWLQQAFFVCRAFESEQLIEGAEPFEAKRPQVGPMPVPDSGGRRWDDVSSPSTMIGENLQHGTFTFNFEFHERFLREVEKGKFVHALVLTCDPAKHGVMSPLLNLAMTAHVEQIYALGLDAASLALRAFCTKHKFQPSAI